MSRPIQVTMPKLGLTMEEGTVEQWLKQPGDRVEPEEPIMIVAMDKASVEVGSPGKGVLAEIVVPEGVTVPVGTILAWLGSRVGASAPAAVATAAGGSAAAATPEPPAPSPQPPTPSSRRFVSPRARRRAAELGVDLGQLSGTGPANRIIEADVVEAAERILKAAAAAPSAAPAETAAGAASPSVRRLADALGVDLNRVAGTGPGGRITERDVQAAATPATAPPTAGSRPATTGTRPLTRIRRLTAERMAQSSRTVARVTLFRTVEMDEAVRLRTQLQPEFEAKGTRLSYDLIIAKACALALREHPAVNARWVEGEGITEQATINVGIAVALDPEGLVVPVLRDADRRDLLTLARDLDALAERARAGRLGPDDASGGTFTLTNLGAYGVDSFTPIVNPPETAILGIGRLQKVAVVGDDDTIRPRQRLELALSFDHRAVDGAPAARCLARIAELIERPYRLLAEWV